MAERTLAGTRPCLTAPTLLALTVLIALSCHNCWAQEQSRAVVVIAGGTSIRDLTDPRLRNLQGAFETGAAGLMNVRTGKPTRDIEPTTRTGMLAGCLTMGSGAMASGGLEVSRAYDATALVGQHRAGDLYRSRTGLRWSPENVLHTEIVKMQRVNAAAAYRASPGVLGSELRQAGIRTAVVGNSDVPNEIHREAVAAAMDVYGKVDSGTVSSPRLVVDEPNSAYGIRTDVSFVADQVKTALKNSRFVVVDFGDTLRADFYCEFCTDKQAAAVRSRAAKGLDELVGELRRLLDPDRDLLLVLSPCSRSFTEISEERLAPILVFGSAMGRGILSSPSTRRPGVVTLSDVAASVLAFFGVEPTMSITGRPIRSVQSDDVKQKLEELNSDAARHSQRQVAMRGGSVFQSAIVLLATLTLVLTRAAKLRRAAAWAALVPIIVPLAMLYLTPIYSGGLSGSVAILACLVALVLAVSILVFRSPTRALAWLSGILASSLVVDIAVGSPLARWSIAGYSLVEGARYYGIGNELMGSLLGATLVFVGLVLAGNQALSRYRGTFAALLFAIVFVFLGSPSLGANAGGSIAATVGFVTALLVRRNWRPSARGMILAGVVAASAVVVVFILDSSRTGSAQSHMGRALGSIWTGDAGGFLEILKRKMELNMMLVSTSLWSRLLGISLAASAALFWFGSRLRNNLAGSVELRGAAAGLVVGTVAALLFNDSGVVAAAACSVLLWSMLAVYAEREQ